MNDIEVKVKDVLCITVDDIETCTAILDMTVREKMKLAFDILYSILGDTNEAES